MRFLEQFRSFYFYSVSSVLLSIHVLCANGDSGWLRVCNSDSNSEQYEIETDKCPHGAWLSDSISTGCFCLNGLWALGNSWCDEDYRLFLGKGHCFKLPGNVQRLAYLGSPVDPFASTNFMTKRNGHIFKPFTDKISTPYEYELNFHNHNINKTILRLQPSSAKTFLMKRTPRVIETSFDYSSPPLCLQSSDTKQPEETTLLVYKIKEAIKSLQITDNCPQGADTRFQKGYENMSTLKIVPGESLHVKSGTIQKSSESCKKSCKVQSPNSKSVIPVIRHKRATKSKQKTSKKALLKGSKTEGNTTSDPPGYSPEDRQHLINEETVRIIKTELMWLLERRKPPRHQNANWRHLQKAKEAFAKVCPEVEVPKFLVNAMLRIFRMLYVFSRDFNPFGQFTEGSEQNQRIDKYLDQCIAGAERIQFDYQSDKINNTVCSSRNDSVTNKAETFCECADSLDKVNLNYTKNTSNPHEYFNMTKAQFALPTNYSYMLIPVSESFNGSNRDFPIETTWKIISFTHYYCAKYFQNNPADHSALLIKLESLFNSEIIYRWDHPGLRTNETWQTVYSAFDMQKFANSVDSCVAAAKHVSEYPEWIIRPTLNTIQRKKRSLDSENIQSAKAYCLQDPWDPVDKLGATVTNECYEWNNL